MEKSTFWTIVIVVILVVLGVILVSIPKGKVTEDAPVSEEAIVEESVLEMVEKAEEAVTGGSLVTEEGEVITPTGEAVSNEALPGSQQAPRQTPPLTEPEIPQDAVKLSVSPNGFEPNEFSVRAGKVVTLSITSTEQTHVFKFDDPSLQAVAIGLASKETRAITFKAPAKGDYTFYCDVPGHRGRGETGVMRVK